MVNKCIQIKTIFTKENYRYHEGIATDVLPSRIQIEERKII